MASLNYLHNIRQVVEHMWRQVRICLSILGHIRKLSLSSVSRFAQQVRDPRKLNSFANCDINLRFLAVMPYGSTFDPDLPIRTSRPRFPDAPPISAYRRGEDAIHTGTTIKVLEAVSLSM